MLAKVGASLFLDNNLFKSFQLGLFQKLNKLEELSLKGNSLETDQHEDIFMGLESLRKLGLFETPLAQSVDRNAPV